MDTNSPIGSEGIPHEFLSPSCKIGVLGDQDAVDAGQVWQPKPKVMPVVHRREFPLDNAVVTFP
jgi:hypothetical protein